MLYLLIGYMWLFIHRPFEIWPVLGAVRLEFVYIIIVLIAWAFYPQKRWLPNKLHAAFFAFAVAVVMCWLASPWKTDYSDLLVENYFKRVLFAILLVTVIHDKQDLRLFMRAFLVIMAIYMAHSLKEFLLNDRHVYRMDIPRMVGIDETMNDPNAFAGSILCTLPFLPLFRLGAASEESEGQKRFDNVFTYGYLLLAIVCIIFTGSRSAFLGLMILSVIAIAKSHHRWRFAGLFVLVAPCVWLLLPGYLQTRFESIVVPDVAPESAQESSKGRLEGLKMGIALWEDNPVLGVGPGNWKPATGSSLEAHNLYGQVLGEMGTLGAVTFLAILWGLWANFRSIRDTFRTFPSGTGDFAYAAASATGASVLLLLLEGNFGHNLFRFNWLWCGAFMIVARYVADQSQAQWAPHPTPVLDGADAWADTASLAKPL